MLFYTPPAIPPEFVEVNNQTLIDKRISDLFLSLRINSYISEIRPKLNSDIHIGFNRIQVGQSTLHLFFSEESRLLSKSIVHILNYSYMDVDSLKALVSQLGCVGSIINPNDVKEISRNSVEFSKSDGVNISYVRAMSDINTWVVCGSVVYSHFIEGNKGFKNSFGSRF